VKSEESHWQKERADDDQSTTVTNESEAFVSPENVTNDALQAGGDSTEQIGPSEGDSDCTAESDFGPEPSHVQCKGNGTDRRRLSGSGSLSQEAPNVLGKRKRLVKKRQYRKRSAAPCQPREGDTSAEEEPVTKREAAIADYHGERGDKDKRGNDPNVNPSILLTPQDPSTGLPRRNGRTVSWKEKEGEIVAECYHVPQEDLSCPRDPEKTTWLFSNREGRTHTGQAAEPIRDADIHEACAWRKAVRHADTMGIPMAESEFRPTRIILWRKEGALVFSWKKCDRHKLHNAAMMCDYVVWERREFIRRSPPYMWEEYGHMGITPNDKEIKRALFPNGDYGSKSCKPKYACSTEQIFNAVKYLRALKVVRKWLVDTGCGSDLINREIAEKYAAYIRDAKPVMFNTANDAAGSTRQLHLVCEELGGDNVEAYVMGSTPPVMSVGKRIKRGFSFIWIAGCAPCFVTPSGDVVALDVRSDIPYLKADGLHARLAGDPRQIAEATGIVVVRGRIKIVGTRADMAAKACSAEENGQDRDEPSSEGLPHSTADHDKAQVGATAQGGGNGEPEANGHDTTSYDSGTTLYSGSQEAECKSTFWPDSGWESDEDWDVASSTGSTGTPA